MKNDKIKNFREFYGKLKAGPVSEYTQEQGVTAEEEDYEAIIWHPKGYYFGRTCKRYKQYRVLTAFGTYITNSYFEAAKHLWHNFVKHEEGHEEVSAQYANELAITCQMFQSINDTESILDSLDKIVGIAKDFIDKYPVGTKWGIDEDLEWEETLELFYKEWHDNQEYMSKEIEVWVEGHWDLPWESDGDKRPIYIYTIGEVLVVKMRELDDKIDELENMGTSYLIPTTYTSPKWNGKIKYIGHKTNSNR